MRNMRKYEIMSGDWSSDVCSSDLKMVFTGTDIKDGFYHSDVVYQKI